MKLQRIRGTEDLYDAEMELFNHVINSAKKLAQQYCFKEISTPIIENSQVFHRTLGETSDIVNKETYSFIDRNATSITLRPEFTAAIVRAIISNGMLQSIPLRLFSYGPLFRHERPQKCRLRQFHQLNFEYIGCSSFHVDVELISFANNIFTELKINNLKLRVNTLGSKECRDKYKVALVEYLSKYINSLSDISQQRLLKNPLRILDTKDLKEQEILNKAPILYNFIDSSSKDQFEKILSHLQDLNIDYVHSSRLVRGIDYYSDFVFEFVTENLGSQGTVVAGGRYNTLISQMGESFTPAVGFAGGIERIMTLVKIAKNNLEKSTQIYLIPIGDNAENLSHKIAQELRNFDINILIDYGITMKKRMQKANKYNVKYSILFGDDELKKKMFLLKNMSNGTEISIKQNELQTILRKNKLQYDYTRPLA